MIHEHLLIFETSDQAITAKHALSGRVQATKSKVTEHQNQPVVIFQTEDKLSDEICDMLIFILCPAGVTFNRVQEMPDFTPVASIGA